MDNEDRVHAARVLGMKPSEIRAVDHDGDDSVVVTTHDGTRTRVDVEGTLTFLGTDPVPAAPAAEPAEAEEGLLAKGGLINGPAGSAPDGDPVVGVKRKMAEVLAWVEAEPDHVKERATLALDAENAGPESDRRASLITKLEGLAGL